jgi:hypothetical protein
MVLNATLEYPKDEEFVLYVTTAQGTVAAQSTGSVPALAGISNKVRSVQVQWPSVNSQDDGRTYPVSVVKTSQRACAWWTLWIAGGNGRLGIRYSSENG